MDHKTGALFEDVINNRKSTREFSNERIPEKLMIKLIEQVSKCPSAGNLHSYYICLVKNGSKKQEIAEQCSNQLWIERVY